MVNAPRTRDGAVEPISDGGLALKVSPELEADIVEGIAEFERGEYIELTREQLEHAATTGEWPWGEDESRD
jgi:hypothetical protein